MEKKTGNERQGRKKMNERKQKPVIDSYQNISIITISYSITVRILTNKQKSINYDYSDHSWKKLSL
jgi:hypothetical protein